MPQDDKPTLNAILAQQRWKVRPERFALVGLQPRERQLALRLFPSDTSPFTLLFNEPEMVTMVLPETAWRSIAPAFPRARVQRPYRVISFELDLPADLVGFMAAVTRQLADAGVPLLAACGYTRDHLMVLDEHLTNAMAALDRLASESQLR